MANGKLYQNISIRNAAGKYDLREIVNAIL